MFDCCLRHSIYLSQSLQRLSQPKTKSNQNYQNVMEIRVELHFTLEIICDHQEKKLKTALLV